jgi:hypothetical protein
VEVLARMLGINAPDKLETTHRVLHYTDEQQVQMAVDMLLERGFQVIPPKDVEVEVT